MIARTDIFLYWSGSRHRCPISTVCRIGFIYKLLFLSFCFFCRQSGSVIRVQKKVSFYHPYQIMLYLFICAYIFLIPFLCNLFFRFTLDVLVVFRAYVNGVRIYLIANRYFFGVRFIFIYQLKIFLNFTL